MRRGALLLVVAIALAACRREGSPAVATPDGTITVANSDVEFGVAFPLTVTRVVRGGATSAGELSLTPLVTRLEATTTTTTGAGATPDVVEERRYEAWAFTPGEIDLPSTKLHVRTSLPPDDAGRPELPEEPLPVPRPSRVGKFVALAVAAAVALAAIAFVSARRRRHAPAVESAPRVAAETRARARIAALRQRPLAGVEELVALHDEAASLLREYVEERFEPSATRRTSEELLAVAAGAPSLGAAPRARLSAFLPPLDRIRFGRAPALRDAALHLLDELDSFVSETSP